MAMSIEDKLRPYLEKITKTTSLHEAQTEAALALKLIGPKKTGKK